MSNLKVNTITDEAGTGAPDFTEGAKVAGNNIPTSGPLSGFRNAIINGNFDHWQRGTSFSGVQYGADRWRNSAANSSISQDRVSFTLGQTDVPNEPEYFCRTAVTSAAGAGNFALLTQRIEGVRTFAGQTVTLSFWAKADAAKNIAVEFEQFFGSGGSPSATVTSIGVTTLSLTTSWQKFTVTAEIPSLAGKTVGTDGRDNLRVNIWFDAGSDFNARTNSLGQQSGTFDIAQVQLEAGTVATPFERRSVGTELALCQRYYEFINDLRFQVGGGSASAVSIVGTAYYRVTKRAIASITIPAPPAGSTYSVDRNSPQGVAISRNYSSPDSFPLLDISVTADAEL